MSDEYGEVKDLEDKINLYSNLMMESHNAGIQDALVIRKEAKKVKAEIKSDVRELVEEVIKLRKVLTKGYNIDGERLLKEQEI
tara:strand:- start:947 stop:1195 length:249 start_codon:yes stop_codon:yes gene_type:complete